MKNIIRSLCAAVAMVAFGSGFAEPQRGGDLVHIYSQFPPHFNSGIKSGATLYAGASNIFVGLVEINENFEAEPYLAKTVMVAAMLSHPVA